MHALRSPDLHVQHLKLSAGHGCADPAGSLDLAGSGDGGAYPSTLVDRYSGGGQVTVRGFDALMNSKATDFDASAMAGSDNLEIFVAHDHRSKEPC